MIPFKSFIRQLCEAVNSVARDRQAELDTVLSGTFTKEMENGTDLYTPREVRFKVPYTDDKDQTAWRTVQVPLATLVTPRTVQMDKITFSVDCSLSLRSGELMMGKPRRFHLFHKSVNTRIEFTLKGGGNAQELETLIADYEAGLRKVVEK